MVAKLDTQTRRWDDSTNSTSTTPSTYSSDSSSLDSNEDGDSSDELTQPPPTSTSEKAYGTLHSEFGHCLNQEYRRTSRHTLGSPVKTAEEHDPPYYILLSTYVSYLFLICIGHMRDFFGKRLTATNYIHLMSHDGYAALNSDFDSFYTRRLKQRIDDLFSRPVTGVPGRTIMLLDREFSANNTNQHLTGTRTRALNISSYNYLGFAQATGGCADAVEEGIRQYGVSACGARLEGGSVDFHMQAEKLVARFVGMEDSLLSSMGFATNSTIIPALCGRGSLVISDELNHASIRFGVRLSGASVRMFKHNDMESLEALLREVISQGQPRTHRSWRKIVVIVEGLYSMEGTLVNLPGIMALKDKYKFYLFVDEAHSIGALGPHGRGVADYFSISPRRIDILMGTFTKSFGAAGGYIAGSKTLIDSLRAHGHSGAYAESMSPPVLTQVIASMASIMGVEPPLPPHSPRTYVNGHANADRRAIEAYDYPGTAPTSLLPQWLSLPPHLRDGSEGRERLRRLAFNARYLSIGLQKLGFITYGHPDSPIIPLLLFNPGKMPAFSRMMLARKTPIVVVVVAYPATPLVTSRVRFCVSASHTKADVDTLLRACDEIGDALDLKHGPGKRWSVERVIEHAVELVRGEVE
ncbi:serine palmitoyltransferase 2 [Rickenella mellea]|uniref:serine C-palmitoyltransferase n=1 Tax=Rickenella mellea TaxID=50990 RepID=A0A4Y7PZR2_9AGAM|nr:serine palmitoyltransferase 2 [Rickenella mellea]